MSWGGRVAVAGVYESPRRKAPGVHPFEIHAECVRGALEDAGLAFSEVDGLCSVGGTPADGTAWAPVLELAEWLGLSEQLRYVDGTETGGCSPIAQAGRAAAQIAAGAVEVAVVSYAECSYSLMPDLGTGTAGLNAQGPGAFEMPYGFSVAGAFALMAQRHMHEYGTTPEQLARVAVQCRANAASNPDARYREPLTVEDVLASPMIASPLHRFDCCVVTDSGGAVVLVGEGRARECRKPPVWLLGFGEALGHAQMNQMDRFTSTPAVASGQRAFAMAGVSHDDVDVAQLYDAFTITPLLALEDLGFCAKGEGGPFVESGAIAPGGQLPINTDGGGLSSNHPGRRGMFLLVESVRQLRGEGVGVQIAGARTALAHGLGGANSATATMILGV
ncbi:MAG: hypothetical protein IT201_08550 [Thermoleophilia bacterium]|nr:hypothetical protein [Thermoleophilia bacterium]